MVSEGSKGGRAGLGCTSALHPHSAFCPPSRASPRVCPPVGRAHGEVVRGLCSLLLLSLLSDPSGSSDSLHSGSPSDRPRLLRLSPRLSVSVSRPALRLPTARSPPPCLGFFPQEPAERSRRVEGSALPAQITATPRTFHDSPRSAAAAAAAWIRVPRPPPPLLPPPRRRRGRPRPDALSPARYLCRKKTQKLQNEGRATFPLCFG